MSTTPPQPPPAERSPVSRALSLPPMPADAARSAPAFARWWWRVAGRGRGHEAGLGVRRNRRLTASTGVVLLPLLVLVTLTGWQFGGLWRFHYLAGFVLLPPLLVKLVSTGYRFGRYYTRNPAYRSAGPPAPLLRILAPLLVADVIVVMVSGIVLYAEHSQEGVWSKVHSVSVFFCIFLVAAHVLWYFPVAVRETADDVRPSPSAPRGVGRRRAVVVGSVAAGLVLGGVTAVSAQQPARHGRSHARPGQSPAPPAGVGGG